MPAQRRYFVGAMTGTSADGIDAALAAITGAGTAVRAELVRHVARPMPPPLRDAIIRTRGQATVALAHLAQLTRDLSVLYGETIAELLADSSISAGRIVAIGAHGQTLFHNPPLTIQALDPSLLVALTGCVVVSDFRRADCAAGGQGAPLAPWADWVVFRDEKIRRVILNIGGIANVTCLAASGSHEGVIAFDTGPGNCLSDELMRRRDASGIGFDAGGRLALRGKVDAPLAEKILAGEWFARRPPKSTDGPDMIRIFQAALNSLDRAPGDDDLLATAASVTGRSIAGALARFGGPVDEVIVAGGGAANGAIMKFLAEALGDTPLRMSDELGIPTAAREAMAFAILAAATLDGIPGNIPAVTGATRGVVCGSITPRP